MRVFTSPFRCSNHSAVLSLACVLGVLSLTGGCALPSGMTRSRWAIEDEDCAAKYADGAEKTEPLKKIKQASDARFLSGSEGKYFSSGLGYRPDPGSTAMIDIGVEQYATSYMTDRLSLMGLAG